ncbi:MAG: cytochrome b/b6 domain-containing protein [Desulfarculaceae bacterium]|nr:cytochrome b/b6 domain-containing protein [Desulfarculaceae bacterium]
MMERDLGKGQVERFSVLNRLLHVLVMVGFLGLGITGFSLFFGGAWWARAIAWCLGGAAGLAWTHRFLAVMTYAAVMAHLIWLVYYKLVLKGRLTGPGTMFPRPQDVKDVFRHLGWALGRGPQPRFDRFAWWEKMDYWAVLLGMNTMGLTGLVLWFPEWFSQWLPGYFINIALLLHLFEAIIAVAIKFVVHPILAHLRPEVWPADTSIFTGRMSAERIRHEHPALWERMNSGSGEAGS